MPADYFGDQQFEETPLLYSSREKKSLYFYLFI